MNKEINIPFGSKSRVHIETTKHVTVAFACIRIYLALGFMLHLCMTLNNNKKQYNEFPLRLR